ncbi:MAG: glycerophosphodiester phosphodiesterase family protein [Anaerolineae bacterium]
MVGTTAARVVGGVVVAVRAAVVAIAVVATTALAVAAAVGAAAEVAPSGATTRSAGSMMLDPAPVVAVTTRDPAAVVAADRGYSAVAPENTLAALRAASAAGLRRAWVDVRSTSDDVPVLLHDAALDRTTDCAGPVTAMTAAVLATCDAGSWFGAEHAGEAVPLLAQALDQYDGTVTLDLHDVSAELAFAVIDGAGAASRVEIATADAAEIAEVESARPGTVTWYRSPLLNGLVISSAVGAGAYGVAVDQSGLELSDVVDAHDAGLLVAAIGIETEWVTAQLADAGADLLVASRAEAVAFTVGSTFRTYAGPDFGRVDQPGSEFASGMAIGDFDADGRSDLVLAAPRDGSAVSGGGWVGGAHGGAGFPVRLFGAASSDRDAGFGGALVVGDFNDDGYSDLVIGSPLRSFSGPESGALHLWSGGAAGLGDQSRPFGPSLGDGGRLGSALADGDFNGDGVIDLAVSAPNLTVAGKSGAGRVVLLPGRTGAGPVTGGSLAVDRESEDVPGEPETREGFGASLAAGDFDGDGLDDLVVGIPDAAVPGAPGAGSIVVAYLMIDPDSGLMAIREAVEITRADDGLPGEASRLGEFGAALAAADFDGDGIADLAIGSPGAAVGGQTGAGDVMVLRGGVVGLDPSTAMLYDQTTPLVPGEPESRGGFGASLAVGDLDGDGVGDLLVGSPAARGGPLPEVGGLTVLFGVGRDGNAGGGSTREPLDARRAWHVAPGMSGMGVPRGSGALFGASGVVADLNGDAVADLAIGAPGQSVNGVAETGALVVAWGYDDELPGVPTATPPPRTATPSPSPGTPSVEPPTATPFSGAEAYLPYTTRLRSLDKFPTPDLP